MKVLKQLEACQQGHLAIRMLNVADNMGVDVVFPFKIIETRQEPQGALTQNGLCDNNRDGATTPARRNRR